MQAIRILIASGIVLATASCHTHEARLPADSYAGEYALFAYAPSFVRIGNDGGLTLHNLYQGSNPWARLPPGPATLRQHSATEFSYENTRITFSQRENGRFQSLTMSPMGFLYERAEGDSAAGTEAVSRQGPQRLVGSYRPSASAAIDEPIHIVALNGALHLRRARGPLNPLQQMPDGSYLVGESGARLTFEPADGTAGHLRVFPPREQERRLSRIESLARDYLEPQQQSVHLEQMRKELSPGQYTFSRFNSPSRGPVDFAVYLPPGWRDDGQDVYPLIFFLHGQDGSEHGFTFVVPAARLNSWIERGFVPPFVLIALRSGRMGRIEEQWSSVRNETLLTSAAPDELRAFVQQHFRAGPQPGLTSIHGHSRGALGALHFALKYPHLFGSAVSNSLVSDYAFPEESANARQRAANIIDSGILYRISIGDSDQFTKEMGRRIAADTHALLEQLAIPHEYEVLTNVTHDFGEVWNRRRPNNEPNGLYELRLHARAWRKATTARSTDEAIGEQIQHAEP